ncbi:mechanosensitive ion channel [Brevibacterium jeotgali]|uniref:Conserved TM helix n=1 Tax=Brevibacterium jeotgali TaxID=1262550 RepID=A0A2H1L629_9MICO|nr:mechanosensitive ion channel [Brevibacterium jeotgali]TWB98848.1 putative transporter (transmembrane protein) [Brevibacterium jeotgali]SMY12322.1 Conserved TM helix [Brevibacterium jeotgali]
MDLQSFDWAALLEKAIAVIAILLVAWIVAWAVKWVLKKLVTRVPLLQRSDGNGESLGNSIGQIASLLVWLFALIAILQVFALEQVLRPVQDLLGTALGFIPNIVGAGFVFFIGFVLARIVKQLLDATIGRIDFAGLVGRARTAGGSSPVQPTDRDEDETTSSAPSAAEAAQTNARITSAISTTAFALILIVVSISALQILGISAISDPATAMLDMILAAIPLVLAAAILLGIGALIAKFAGTLLENILHGVGTDRFAAQLGVEPSQTSVSSILAKVAQVAILLFFAIMAARTLGFPEITVLLNEILELGGRVLFGAAVIGAGFFIANLLARMVGSRPAATMIRYGTLLLFVAMGLQFMGIADSIITLAFGSIVVGGALAAALAFGIGGRDAAARALNRLEERKPADGPDAAESAGHSNGPPA